MPKVDNNSFVLSDFISFSITGIARTAHLQNILHCTMRYCQLPYHYIVTKIMTLIGIYRDSSLCLYCDAISAKTRQENYLMGTIDSITRVGRRPYAHRDPSALSCAITADRRDPMCISKVSQVGGRQRSYSRASQPYRSGRSTHWVQVKNPKAPAVKREAEEDWGK
jgi:hypothetical protein